MKRHLAAGPALCAVLVLGLQAASAAPVISGTYYEDTAYVSCPGTDYCQVYFSQFPQATAGKIIVLTELGCELTVSAPILSVALYLGDGDPVYLSRRFHPLEPGPNAVGRVSFHDTTTFPVAGGPGRRPGAELAFLTGTANATGKCMVIGEIK